MKFSNLIGKSHQTSPRAFWALNLFDSIFGRHANDPEERYQANLINSDQTQADDDAGQVQLEALRTGAMECWLIGPNYTWCHSGRVRN